MRIITRQVEGTGDKLPTIVAKLNERFFKIPEHIRLDSFEQRLPLFCEEVAAELGGKCNENDDGAFVFDFTQLKKDWLFG